MPSRPNKTYITTCAECRELTREMINMDRDYFTNKFTDIIDEKFQNRQDIIQKQLTQGKLIKYLIISDVLKWVTVLGIIFYLINKA